MPDAIVTRPFKAHLVLEDAVRRLEVGERIAAAELGRWGRSVDALVHSGRIALVDRVAAEEASAAELVAALERRAGELDGGLMERLQALLPASEGPQEPSAGPDATVGPEGEAKDPAAVAAAGDGAPAGGDGADGAEDDDQGGVDADAPASTPPAVPDAAADGGEQPGPEAEATS